MDEIDSYFCICVKEFKGKICEGKTIHFGYKKVNKCITRILLYAEVNECASNPCQNGGSCSDFVGRYSCSCVQGYSGYSCEISM